MTEGCGARIRRSPGPASPSERRTPPCRPPAASSRRSPSGWRWPPPRAAPPPRRRAAADPRRRPRPTAASARAAAACTTAARHGSGRATDHGRRRPPSTAPPRPPRPSPRPRARTTRPGAPESADLVTDGMAGTRLTLTGYVVDTSCEPIADATVEIWQADSAGAVRQRRLHAARLGPHRRAGPVHDPDGRARASTRAGPSTSTSRSRQPAERR